MAVVILLEALAQALDRGEGAVFLGESALNEAAHTVAHHHGISIEGVGGIPLSLECMVGRCAEIVDRIEQRSVQIKYYKSFHRRQI